MNNIEELESRYQALSADFQAGKMDEARFTAEVDTLQFQDEWGRYWMIGAQSGTWHYYDGQTWHQAEPREADKLPFMDENGTYWQRGVKSGDWYYYQAESSEWVKPNPADDITPPIPQTNTAQRNTTAPVGGAGTASAGVPYEPQPQLRPTDSGPQAPPRSDGELFQDEEGRYWSIGAKTGQWYFYDHNGWHPAHEFQPNVAGQAAYYGVGAQQGVPYQPQPPYQQPQPAQMPYQQPYFDPQSQYYGQPYPPQPGVGYPQQQPPPQAYAQPGPAPQQPVSPQPGYTAPPIVEQAPAQPAADQVPNPPTNKSKSGSWFFYDGDQWLKYSDGDESEAPPPPMPKDTSDKADEPAKKKDDTPVKDEAPKVEAKEEPVVAELFEEEDEAPPEVVDVEIVTVIEAEPDGESYQEAEPIVKEPARRSTAAYAPPNRGERDEDIRPRRTPRGRTRPVEPQSSAPAQPKRQPRVRTASDPGRPVAPRKRDLPHEPTIIIPTESAASNITAAPSPKPRPGSRPVRATTSEQRRARDNTMPMEPVIAAAPKTAPVPIGPSPARGTQPMTPTRTEATFTPAAKVATPTAKPASKPTRPVVPQPEKEGYTFGDVLRSLPSTFWTFVGGMAVLILFAAVILGAGYFFQGDDSGAGGFIAAAGDATPTLPNSIPNQTPTAAPTATVPPESFTPEIADLTAFSSVDLDMTLEYPENWQLEEGDTQVVFSPSTQGLNPNQLNDSAFWISKAEDVAIADLLVDVLGNFPADAETLNEGTISIASQTWTSAQIRFEDENLGGEGIATIAVTTKDEVGYTLVAVAPAPLWNTLQPVYQEMINSFRFGAEAVAEADETTTSGSSSSSASGSNGTEKDDESSVTKKTPTPTPSPTSDVKLEPVTYVIKSGDTLLAIASQYGVDTDLLADENGITNPNSLRLGQELIIPFTAEELAAWYDSNGQSASTAAADSSSEDETAALADEEDGGTASNNSTSGGDDTEAASASSEAASEEAASLGGRIVYSAFNPAIDSYDVWMVDVGSGEQTVVADNASQPSFNRDGSLLAYRSWSLDTRGIFFRDFVGGRGGQVTRFVEDGLPTWAPDGYAFTFVSRREGDRAARLFSGNQSGTGDTPIGFLGQYVSAFPDGRLAVKGCSISGDCGLYVMGANGGGPSKISSDAGDNAPAVSPDGGKIAIMSSGRGTTNWEIWVINADGSNPQQLTDNRSNEGLPTWSPDGQSIAYVSDQGGAWAIWVMNADGSNQRKLVNMSGSPDGTVLYDTDNSKGWLEERISWAP